MKSNKSLREVEQINPTTMEVVKVWNSTDEIMKELGCHKTTICRWIREDKVREGFLWKAKPFKKEILKAFFEEDEENFLIDEEIISKKLNIPRKEIISYKRGIGKGKRYMEDKFIISELITDPEKYSQISGISNLSKEFGVSYERMRKLFCFAYQPTQKQRNELEKWNLLKE